VGDGGISSPSGNMRRAGEEEPFENFRPLLTLDSVVWEVHRFPPSSAPSAYFKFWLMGVALNQRGTYALMQEG